MPRARRGFKARRRRNRIMKHAKGFYGARSRQFSIAVENVHRAWVYAFAHRKRKKRDFRRLWITRINAASRTVGSSYSRLINSMKRSDIRLDRKVLADIAVRDPAGFQAVAKTAQTSARSAE